MNHQYSITQEEVTLRPLEHKDIEQLRIWRNDTENSRFIRKIPTITADSQEAWFYDYLQDDSVLTFAICVNSHLIGSVALYEIEGKSAEFGRLMIGEAKGKGLGRKAAMAVLRVAFDYLMLDEVRAEVSVDNTAALVIYVRLGFCITGRAYNAEAGMDEFKLQLQRSRFFALRQAQLDA